VSTFSGKDQVVIFILVSKSSLEDFRKESSRKGVAGFTYKLIAATTFRN
jgi:hypothetical protein